MIVKVCGMREPDNIRAVEALPQVTALGFIFAPRSPRYVSSPPAYLPQRCRRVGVFVDAAEDDILAKTADYALHAVQLHGRETPGFCQSLRRKLPAGVQLWKALPICQAEDFLLTHDYEHCVDLFLLETKVARPCPAESSADVDHPLRHLTGGTGQQFDWTLLSHYASERPFLLSGGISPDDAPRLRTICHPRLAGIDLNSRFENRPAQKNIQLLKQFLSALQ